MNTCVRITPRRVNGLLHRMSSLGFSRSVGDSGAGKDSGGAGSIREAGGAFKKRESAQEDQFFYNQQKEQLSKLKNNLVDEISFHEEQIQRHKEAIERNKKRVEDLSK